MNFPGVDLLRFYAVQQLWTAEDVDKSLQLFREGRSIRLEAELNQLPQTCLCREIIYFSFIHQ
jgi:hypothetical protein